MTTKVIKKSDSSFIMSTVMPDEWAPDGTVTVSIYDPADGTAIVEDAATTARISDTISAAATAGSFSVVLTTGSTVIDGDHVAIGSDEQGWQRLTVSNYTSSSKTVDFIRSLGEDLVSGSEFLGTDLKYTVDASVAGFDDLNYVKVVWESDGDELPITELWEIQSEQSNVQGLEGEFKSAYPEIYSKIKVGEFANFENRARQKLKLYFDSRQRSFDKIVDSELIKEPMLTEIALLSGKVALDEETYTRLKNSRDEDLTRLNSLSIWTDTNEDNAETDFETQPGQDFILRRGY